MPKYVIEREFPGADQLTAEQLRGIAQQSCQVLRDLGRQINWIHTYVGSDKLYCVYIAPDETLIREHARQGEFPVNRIERVNAVIDLATAEGPVNQARSA